MRLFYLVLLIFFIGCKDTSKSPPIKDNVDTTSKVTQQKDKHKPKRHRKGKEQGSCNKNCLKSGGKKCKHKKKKENDSIKEVYKQIGLKYSRTTQQILGSNLTNAIIKKGPEGAVEFCNTRATVITDSLSLNYKAKIRRVSDKARNTLNKATEQELAYISNYEQDLVAGDSLVAVVEIKETGVDFYYPITTNALCLQCHGKPGEDINSSTLSEIKKYYPQDEALNYKVNEVRGLWAITFNK